MAICGATSPTKLTVPIKATAPAISNAERKKVSIRRGLTAIPKLFALSSPKVKALGEIGLDYYYSRDNREKQILFFEKQLELSKKYDLPVIIHCRNATDDLLRILKKSDVKGVIHCFSGSVETARELIKLGYYLGVGGILTFKNSKLVDVIKSIPIEYILLETDSPFLTPEPFRKYKNEPKYIPIIAEKLAQLKEIDDPWYQQKILSDILPY